MVNKLRYVPEPFGNIDGKEMEVDIKVRITTNEKLREDVIKILEDEDPKTISLDKEYHITSIVGYGDVFDCYIINDLGEKELLGSWIFEDIDD